MERTSPTQSVYTLSEYERIALSGRVNLSDGHARHTLSPEQREIVGRALELLDRCLCQAQENIELQFIDSFFRCAGQGQDYFGQNRFLTFSASSAIKMAAQYCRMRGLIVHLIEPCFDNVVHLLKSENVTVVPVREEQLCDLEMVSRWMNPRSALWLVQPNNPTGFCVDERLFRKLTEVVAKSRSTLMVDFCFRFYAESLNKWDQYKVLDESRVTFICFEDTGKTWSLMDTKVGMTVCSDDVAPIIYRLHDELLLNVSPLHLLLLTEFINNTLKHGIANTITEAVRINRNLVHGLVQKDLVSHVTQWCHNVPMDLLCLPPELPANAFWKNLRERGVDILPAQNYFWSRLDVGANLFRIPLSRPLRDIEIALPIIEDTLLDLGAL